MGPHENLRSNNEVNPINVNEADGAEDEQQQRDDEWHIGFGVEMHGIGRGDGQQIDGGSITDESDSSSSDETPPLTRDGYQQLPLAASNSSAEWLPQMPESAVNLPPISPPEELKIEHKPIDIAMDQQKAEQIKAIMGRMNDDVQLAAPPPWMKDIDDQKLTELVRQLAVMNEKSK